MRQIILLIHFCLPLSLFFCNNPMEIISKQPLCETDQWKCSQGKQWMLCVWQETSITAQHVLMIMSVYLFDQLKEASTALQKTSQQVQKLAQMVSKPSPGAPLLRSPSQLSSPPGEQTHTHTLYLCWNIFDANGMCGFSPPCRSPGFSAGSVCIPGSISVHDAAQPEHRRRRAQSRDDDSGEETHQDLAQRHPRCHQPSRCVTKTFSSSFRVIITTLSIIVWYIFLLIVRVICLNLSVFRNWCIQV